MIENKRYVQFEFPYDDFAVKDNQTNEELWNPMIIDRLNEQEETIQELKKELKNRKKLNTILEGFLLDKGYDFNDIIKFLQDRTEKREGE